MCIDGGGAALGERVAITHKIQQGLPQPHLIGMHRSNAAVAICSNFISVLCQSALPRLAEINRRGFFVAFVPIANIALIRVGSCTGSPAGTAPSFPLVTNTWIRSFPQSAMMPTE
jgi:hypothetical protein